jgi:hypothetical protein
MNTLPIEKVIEDEELNSVSNVFYGSKYMSNNTTSDGKLATSHNQISDKCSVFDYSSSGLIDENDPNYDYYKNSQFYQENNPSNKLNAFLWYYSTGRLDNATLNDTSITSNSNVMNQMKNMGCQILKDKAVKVNTDTNSSVCTGNNIFQCGVSDILGKTSIANRGVLIIIFLISSIFFFFGIIGFIKFMYTFLTKYNIKELSKKWLIWNIVGIIIGYVIGSLVLIYSYTTASNSVETASSDEYVFIPSDQVESFTNGTCSNGDDPLWGCCDDGVTHKIDPLGSNCCVAGSEIPGGTGSETGSGTSSEGSSGTSSEGSSGTNEETSTCSTSTYGCCEGTSIEKTDESGSNCPGCGNTQYGCCDNSNLAKIDEDGTNCESTDGSVSPTLIWFIVLMLLGLICFILFVVFNKSKLLGKIFFILFMFFSLLALNILSGIIQTSDNTGLTLTKQINLNLNVFSNYNSKNQLSLLLTNMFIFFVLLILALFINSKDNNIFNAIKPISWTMFALSFILMFYSFFIFWYKYPSILIVVSLVLRFVWNNILSILTKINQSDFVLNMNALLYHYPLGYFAKLAGRNNVTNLFTGDNARNLSKVDIPTGLPWDLPGIKLIKIIILLLAKFIPNMPNFIPNDMEESVKHSTSNVNIFTLIPFLSTFKNWF